MPMIRQKGRAGVLQEPLLLLCSSFLCAWDIYKAKQTGHCKQLFQASRPGHRGLVHRENHRGRGLGWGAQMVTPWIRQAKSTVHDRSQVTELHRLEWTFQMCKTRPHGELRVNYLFDAFVHKQANHEKGPLSLLPLRYWCRLHVLTCSAQLDQVQRHSQSTLCSELHPETSSVHLSQTFHFISKNPKKRAGGGWTCCVGCCSLQVFASLTTLEHPWVLLDIYEYKFINGYLKNDIPTQPCILQWLLSD